MDNNMKISWPGWETVRLIGRGSFGAVYEIQRKLFDDDTDVEKAALKIISIPQNDSDIEEMYNDGYDAETVTSTFQTHLKSIVAEYSLMRKMNGSSNIVNCDDVRYDRHEDGIGWDIYIKMELLTPLAKALPAEIPEEQVVQIAKDLCTALELCAKHNIIHRDIKPQNIFVSDNGDYKLGDFGIAKTVEKTMGGTKTGTYKYMAPEVFHNQPYNSTADIYSLGLVLYWLLNERRMPFMPLPPAKLAVGMENQAQNRRLSGEAIPAPKHGSEALKTIVLKACAFNPAERYQSAREMGEALQLLSAPQLFAVQPEPVPAPEPAPEKEPEQQMESAVEAEIDEYATVGPVFARPAEAAQEPAQEAEDEDCETVGPQFGPAPTDSSEAGGNRTGDDQENNCNGGRKKIPGWLWGLAGLVLAGLVYLFTAQKCIVFGHEWQAAACTTPKTCVVCSAEEGVPLGHKWQAGTCTTPNTCSQCYAKEGVPLGHKWSTSEGRAECTRCSKPNGIIQQVTGDRVASVWAEKGVDLKTPNGKKVGAGVLNLIQPIENCYNITLRLQIFDLKSGNIYGEWGFYIRDLQGQWHLAGTFDVSNNDETIKMKFAEPISFDAWAVPCHVLGKYWSFSLGAWIAEAGIFEYTG